MSIRPNNVTLTFEGIANSDKGRLIGIRPLIDFNTKAQTGFQYLVLLENAGYEKVTIKVENQPPLLTNDQILESKEPLYIVCDNFSAKFYMSDRTKNYELTCKAEKVSIVRQVAKP